MGIEKIVFFYMYVSICIVLFNILFIVYNKYQKQSMPKRIEYIKNYIASQNDIRQKEKRNSTYSKTIVKRLKNTNNLRAFQEVLIEEKGNREFEKKLYVLAPECIQLATIYRKKRDIEQAYFAYMISLIGFNVYTRDVKKIVKVLLTFIRGNTIYVKENVFKAILVIGEATDVLESLRIMNEEIQEQSEKLISDNLLSFRKDHQKLANLLHDHIDDFSPTIQVAIMNYLRYLPSGVVKQAIYFKPLYLRLMNSNKDKEVRLAIIRYFKKYYYQPVSKVLIELASSEEEYMWEYAAVAITSLQSYPSVKTIQVLKQSVAHPNWYIRFNAAESLIALQIGEQDIWKGQYDAYGKEMMKYRRGIKEIKRR